MIPLLLAAAAAIAVAAFWYGKREEPVRGREFAAVLRAGAVFLLLSGLFLPSLVDPVAVGTPTVALVDASWSMNLPASESGFSRFDSAVAILPSLAPGAVYTFGSRVSGPADGVADSVKPEQPTSRAARAIETAALSGADSVWILTDGDLDDRAETRRAAERVGLGLREVRVAQRVTRIGIVDVDHPARIGSGDTFEVRVSLVASAGREALPDSIEIVATAPDGASTSAWALVPSQGRRSHVRLEMVANLVGAQSVWRRYEIRLQDDADPLGAADRRTAWIEVTPGTRGVVVLAMDPDWEAGYLTPVLDRSSVDGVRSYLRTGPGRYSRVGPLPGGVVTEAQIRRDLSKAALVVVQARPEGFPAWLAGVLARAPSVLYLVRGTGTLPGTQMTVEEEADGEWYVRPELPPSPIAGLFAGLRLGDLPPLAPVYGTSGAVRWNGLVAMRDRQGSARPLAAAGVSGEQRWAAVLARGTWRWAARGGAARQAYRALYSGLAGWLLEAGDSTPVEMVDRAPGADIRIGWRIAPDVRDLAITLEDSIGAVLWSAQVAEPDTVLVGPWLPVGQNRFKASGESAAGMFEVGHPFSVHAPVGEAAPRASQAPIALSPAGRDSPAPRRRALWPFVLSAVLLCAEWLWRRRIGLR